MSVLTTVTSGESNSELLFKECTFVTSIRSYLISTSHLSGTGADVPQSFDVYARLIADLPSAARINSSLANRIYHRRAFEQAS